VKRDAPREVIDRAGAGGAGEGREDAVAGFGMAPQFKSHVAFHLTGHRIGDTLESLEGRGLRPALLAAYRNLDALRYDFPLVLEAEPTERGWMRSLSDIVDELLRGVAPRGIEGEKARREVLNVERGIRRRIADGASGSLLSLWEQAARGVAAPGEPPGETLGRARAALKERGEVVGCDKALPERLFVHAWKAVQTRKTLSLREDIDRLVLKLSDILKSDFARSAAGRSSDRLRASIGPVHEQTFDFDAMSRMLARNADKETLPEQRRRRIERVLAVLGAQRFVRPGARGSEADNVRPHDFLFESCTDALKAFRRRLPELIELVKAIATAELEIEGRYIEPAHDLLFEQFDEQALGPRDLRLFPDYLIVLHASRMPGTELAALMEALSSGMPVKVMVQTDDLLPLPAGGRDLSLNLQGMRLASMALGLSDVFVMQSSASNLYQAREHIFRGIAHSGPALFSVYSGVAGGTTGLPPYLVAAAAMQSRAFPAFVYDPSSGPDLATRFSLEGNPQLEQDWPVESFAYEDEAHQRIEEKLAFTFVDFAVCDPRYAEHFATVPRAEWDERLVPLAQSLAREPDTTADDVPYTLLVDEQNRLRRAIVHEKLLAAARRCGETWRSLQELGGVHSSHAEKLLARERKRWEEAKQKEIEALWREARPAAPAATVPIVTVQPIAATGMPALAEAETEAPSDEPYIETPRCTSCNECTNLNNRLFAYNDNKQAYVKDAGAGTYRELVEAAESCQVSIIHPGKPRNPKEPGLEELLRRAAPFL